jgi:hypothetical protein
LRFKGVEGLQIFWFEIHDLGCRGYGGRVHGYECRVKDSREGGEHGRKSIEFKVEGPGYKVWRKVNDYELGV